jgi:peroxiredoxin Q/BCP
MDNRSSKVTALFRTMLVAFALPIIGGCGASGPPAEMASVGSAAPAFSLSDQNGRVRTLEEFRGRPVVLYFYPRDATPGCTREACAFRDAWTRLQAAGAVVLGVSTDDSASHQRFITEHELPFDLLSDSNEAAAHAYGVPVHFGFTSRMTFLIDARGQVAQRWHDVDPGVHADEVLAAIEAL